MSLLRQAVEASREQGLGGPGKGIPDRGYQAKKNSALHDVIKKGPQRIYHPAAELLVGQQDRELA